MFMFIEEVSSTHVGRQHAFLDQAMRIVTYQGYDTLNLALIGKHHLGFYGLKINRTTLLAGLQQGLE